MRYTVGTLKKSGFIVVVSSDMRLRHPQFIVADPKTGQSANIHICKAAYTRKYRDGDLRLFKYEAEELQDWLKDACPYTFSKGGIITNYMAILNNWNMLHPEHKLNSAVQPDYSNLYKDRIGSFIYDLLVANGKDIQLSV